jgi:hypothetical protein
MEVLELAEMQSDGLTGDASASDTSRVPRRRALLAARIVFNNGDSTVDCQARDVSSKGARLALDGSAMLPQEFELRFLKQGDSRRVRLVWQRGTDIGVRYLDVSGEGENECVETALRSEVRELKAEVARLQARIIELTQG